MSEELKVCSTCGESKPVSAYSPRKLGRGGLNAQCRTCRAAVVRAYRRTAKGAANTAATNKRHRSGDKHKARRNSRERARYRSDAKYRAAMQAAARYFGNTAAGRAARNRAGAKYRAANELKIKARAMVNHRIASGKLPAPDSLNCTRCGGRAQEYHHHRGYKRPEWLHVVPVCKLCHEILDHEPHREN